MSRQEEGSRFFFLRHPPTLSSISGFAMNSSRPPTLFEQRVYDALKRIPAGRVTTYKELARFLNVPSPRAVGQALKRNPHAPQVPCHRVIRSDGSLGGYQGDEGNDGLKRKQALLRQEAIPLSGDRLADWSCFFPLGD